MTLTADWRGEFGNREVNELHAAAFGTRVFDEAGWNWVELTHRHSLGWVTARDDGRLVGFVNVLWDGLVHAWLQDLMVAADRRHEGVATRVVARATHGARAAGCDWQHVDFDADLAGFYLGACGFTPTSAGLKPLR